MCLWPHCCHRPCLGGGNQGQEMARGKNVVRNLIFKKMKPWGGGSVANFPHSRAMFLLLKFLTMGMDNVKRNKWTGLYNSFLETAGIATKRWRVDLLWEALHPLRIPARCTSPNP